MREVQDNHVLPLIKTMGRFFELIRYTLLDTVVLLNARGWIDLCISSNAAVPTHLRLQFDSLKHQNRKV